MSTLFLSLLCPRKATAFISTLSLHDALPISTSRSAVIEVSDEGAGVPVDRRLGRGQEHELLVRPVPEQRAERSEEHTSELQSLRHLVCRLLLEKKKQERTGAH